MPPLNRESAKSLNARMIGYDPFPFIMNGEMKKRIAKYTPGASVLLMFVLIFAACSVDVGSTTATRTSPTLSAWQQQATRKYLQAACAEKLDPANLNSLMLHLTCEKRGLGPEVPPNVVPLDAWDHKFDKIYRLRDTSDFDMLRFVNLLYAFGGHPAVPQELWQRLEKLVLTFKYWYSDPTPKRILDGTQVIDNMWYWSENHILIFHTCEYLAGQLFPDKTFTATGHKGSWHKQRAEKEIRRWLKERGKWGFTEWHSDVYYNWDMIPLLSLIEWADNENLANRARMVLDLLWLDLALHTHKGNMGVTHGRSYIKDKAAAVLQDVFPAVKLVFDTTTKSYPNYSGTFNALFVRSRYYDIPPVLRTIARDNGVLEDRERMNLPIPEEAPAAPNAPVPPAPAGLSWDSEQDLPLWWSMSALTSWPLLPMTFRVANKYNLWDGQLRSMKIFQILGGMAEDPAALRTGIFPIYKDLWNVVTAPLLKEVNTYTYRTADYMLSAAQDYRPGGPVNQIHSWQATLDESAVVFTTQPAYLPLEGNAATSPTHWDWNSDQPGPGYWTGNGSQPRVAAYKNAAIILYAPQYNSAPLGIKDFSYRNETHAYFPVAHFDEVTGNTHWTFGRKGASYIALWSAVAVTWRVGQPEVFQNDGKPFDLVAENNARNIWLVTLGSRSENGDFSSFMAAMTASAITVTDPGDTDNNGFEDGYTVAWQHPTLGELTFGWRGDFSVAGVRMDLNGYRRFDNRFVQADFGDGRYLIRAGKQSLDLNFATATRTMTSP